MLPQTSANSSRSIFINPNFNKPQPAHINPNFLVPRSTPSTIHLNPDFLQKQVVDAQLCQNMGSQLPPLIVPSTPAFSTNMSKSKVQMNRILSKSRTKIVREPMQKPVTSVANNTHNLCYTQRSLVKIGLRKLVRESAVSAVSITPVSQNILQKQGISMVCHSRPSGKYKIDRRRNEPLFRKVINKYRKRSFVGRYALRRCSETRPIKKIRPHIAKRSTMKAVYNAQNNLNRQNKLQMININGVLYKSTRNKLQRNDAPLTQNKFSPSSTEKTVNKTGERILIVRGNKFVLDKHGFKITRVTPTRQAQRDGGSYSLKRIDIGGLTYIAKSSNVFVRTGNHLARNHVSTAKQKSIHMLSRNFVKSNVPCAIYQRVGKCAAFERGKCMKVHNKMQISICQRFLRGECSQVDCLLSHNVSLSKMPVCKFFLQGCCIRADCPYLHKKLSQSTEICSDFVKGFCQLAEQCNKRHEFLCADFESKGKCTKIKCLFCNRKKHRDADMKLKQNLLQGNPSSEQRQLDEAKTFTDSIANSINTRYFVKENEELEKEEVGDNANEENRSKCNVDLSVKDDNVSSSVYVLKPSRLKLGDLPAFIPFS